MVTTRGFEVLFTVHELFAVSSAGGVVFFVSVIGEEVGFTVMFSVVKFSLILLPLEVRFIVLVRSAAVVVSQKGCSWLVLPVVLKFLVVTVIVVVKGENLESLSSSCKWFGMVVVSNVSSNTARGSLAPGDAFSSLRRRTARDKPAVYPNNNNSKTENSNIV